jgi:hypothetical protein
MSSQGYSLRARVESERRTRHIAPQLIRARALSRPRRAAVGRDTRHMSTLQPAPALPDRHAPAAARLDTLVNWLAVLTLLALGIVWGS